MRCGVIVYLHVPKTGGSTVTEFLRRHASGGDRGGWWHASISSPNTTWSAIASRLRQRGPRPKQFIIHHVESPTSLLNAAHEIQSLDCWLRSHGCRLVLTTTLREAASRAASAAYYNRVPHWHYMDWVAEHASNGAVSFLLHNRVRRFQPARNRTLPSEPSDLRRAQSMLAQFTAVGRTEQLGAFLEYLRSLIGPAGDEGGAVIERANDTPQSVKYELTAGEREWTRSHNRLDEELYASLCKSHSGGGACAWRAVRSSEVALRCAEV